MSAIRRYPYRYHFAYSHPTVGGMVVGCNVISLQRPIDTGDGFKATQKLIDSINRRQPPVGQIALTNVTLLNNPTAATLRPRRAIVT